MERVRTQPFVVVRAFIEDGGKFLMIQENWGEVKGLWNFPAGWLDLGEDPTAAVIREAKEETGYDFKPDSLLGIYSWLKPTDDGAVQPIEIIYRGKISGRPAPVNPREVAQIKWFSPDEILTMDEKTLRDEVSK